MGFSQAQLYDTNPMPKDIDSLFEHGIWQCEDDQWWAQVCPLIGYIHIFEAGDIKCAIRKHHKEYVDAPVKIPFTKILVGNGFHVHVDHLKPIRSHKMHELGRSALIACKDKETSVKGDRALRVVLPLFSDPFGPPSRRCTIITDKEEQLKCRDLYIPHYDKYVEIKYDFQGGRIYKSFSQTNKYPSFMIQTHEKNPGGHH